MTNFFNKIYPSEEGYFPYIYLGNMIIPIYFLFQERTEKLYPGLLLLLLFIFLNRQAFWSKRYTAYFVAAEMAITIVFGYFYNPLYIYIIFVYVFQLVRLPVKWLYGLCAGFTVFSLILVYQTAMQHPIYYAITLIPPLFGGSILPFIMKSSLRYKELNEKLTRVANELEWKNKEMTILEESKKRMLADLSHDLKTPMTSIQGYSRALFEGMVEDEIQKQKYLKYIYDKSIRVTALIDELFMFSKLDNPDFPIYREETDLCEFVRGVIVEFYERFLEKEMELDIDLPDEMMFYPFDPKLLYRAMSNILENTIKYNPNRTDVYIRMERSIDSAIIEIGDNGVGINEDIVETLFDPFVRGDRSRKNDGGTGLGLAITKKIIEKHDGKISVDTQPDRGKTNFIIKLPLRTAAE
ncbi:sensor histidine kinase [Pseudoneobacillus sp. C159]